MVRVLLRELFLTALSLLLVSAVAFAVLDLGGHQDWYNTAAHATLVGLSPNHVTGHDLPLFWNREVVDARVRTERDLALLASAGTREAARARLLRRGTAGLPDVLAGLPRLRGEARTAALGVLAHWAPALTGGAGPPQDEAAALAWWRSFYELRALDFRQNYATRQAQRIVSRASRNASEQLTRLGTYALPALFEVLEGTADRGARVRLTGTIADITGIDLRARPDASDADVRRVVEAWQAFWFAEHLEYDRLTEWQRARGHVTETRYGRWMVRALGGRLGVSATTRRPVALELQERLPTSALVAGLAGLVATAVVVAFGGAEALRQRRLRTRVLELLGALVPGLGALAAGFVALVQIVAAPRDPTPLLVATVRPWFRLALATALLAVVAGLWLRRARARDALALVRAEAEEWVLEGTRPGLRAVVRHALRIGLASLLAPLGLAVTGVLLATLFVEPLLGVHGMGAMTLRAVLHADAPWLLVAALSLVPVALGRRWARRMLVWTLDGE